MKIIYFSFLLFMVAGCGHRRSSNEPSTMVSSGQKFNNPQAQELNELALDKARLEQYDVAIDIFFKALEQDPDNQTILSNIGLTYEFLNDNQKAIEFYKKSFELSDSTYFISGINLGRLYWQINNYSKGIEILDFVITNCKDDNTLVAAYINRGLNYVGKKDCVHAQSDLDAVKNIDPESEELKRQISMLEEKVESCIEQ